VKATWGSLNIRDVRTVAVERWLGQLVCKPDLWLPLQKRRSATK
jgi:hypothetical protein